MRKRSYDIVRLERILAAAMHGGYAEQLGVRRWRLAMAMDCLNPYRFELMSRGSITLEGKRKRALYLHGESRCRKCPPCQKRRSRMWAARAITEWKQWPITVFGTFTMSPQEHYLVDVMAAKLLADRHMNFERATDAERFNARARAFGAEVTKWITRIRSGRDGHTFIPVRYLLVAEAHEGVNTSSEMWQRPHYHMLLHSMELGTLIEGSPHEALRVGEDGEWERRNIWSDRENRWVPKVFLRDESFIKSQWTCGHSKWAWADSEQSAFYVCKYLTKSLHARVRASVKYGNFQGVPVKQQDSPTK